MVVLPEVHDLVQLAVDGREDLGTVAWKEGNVVAGEFDLYHKRNSAIYQVHLELDGPPHNLCATM